MIINWQPNERMWDNCLQRQKNSNLISISSTFLGRNSCRHGNSLWRRIAILLFKTSLSIYSKRKSENTNLWKHGKDQSSPYSSLTSSRNCSATCLRPPWSTTQKGSSNWLLRRWRSRTNRAMGRKPKGISPPTARKRLIWISKTLITSSSTC